MPVLEKRVVTNQFELLTALKGEGLTIAEVLPNQFVAL